MQNLFQDSGSILGDVLKQAETVFLEHRIEGARSAADLLMAHVLDVDRSRLFLDRDRKLTPVEMDTFSQLAERRLNREPVAYLTGTRGFWSLDLSVSSSVLIPRPDTETLVEAALEVFPALGDIPLKVLDMGTGSGAIILSLACERPGHEFFAVDLSVDAATQAATNAKSNGLDDRVSFVCGSWFSPFNEAKTRFDLITSNPPYIPSADVENLEPEIKEFEPRLALDGDHDGLKCLRHIIANAVRFLNPGGWLLLEMGHDQRADVNEIIEGCGAYDSVKFFDDYAGKNRAVRMRKIRTGTDCEIL